MVRASLAKPGVIQVDLIQLDYSPAQNPLLLSQGISARVRLLEHMPTLAKINLPRGTSPAHD